ncbi:MAG: CocE/NonD family hydrolase [Alphaproteobacteria bacterium]
MAESLRPVREIMTAWIPMADGVRLAARLWLPADAGDDPVPAVLEFLPYRRRDGTGPRDRITYPWFAARGIAGVRVDMRGSGDSDGLMTDEYTAQEHADAVQVIAWIAAQPWCTGNVGMMGISWGGFNALQVAALNPPALKAIITCCSTDDRYSDDVHYMGGCLIEANLRWGSQFLTGLARPPDPAVVGDAWQAMWADRLANVQPPSALWLAHQRRDGYWRHGSVCEDYAAVRCAVYAVGGWADGYTDAVARMLEGLSCPRKGLIGPWGHQYPHNGRPGPRIGFLEEMLAWWKHWLAGEITGVMDGPLLRVWLQDPVPPRADYDTRPGRWIGLDDPAVFHSNRQDWRLDAGVLTPPAAPAGAPSNNPPVTIRTVQTVGIHSGAWCGFGRADHPTDQAPEDALSVCFDSAPLDAPLSLVGTPALTCRLSADQPQANLIARLTSVAPDGTSLRLSYGVLNLTHAAGHATARALVPGAPVEVRLRLHDLAEVVPAGHRLRLALSTTCWPTVWPSPVAASVTLDSLSARLHLPVHEPALESRRPLPDFAPPQDETPARAAHGRDIRFDPASGAAALHIPFGSGNSEVRHDDLDLTVSSGGDLVYSVEADDPLTARAVITGSHHLRRDGWDARIDSRHEMWATAEDFRLLVHLEARAGGEVVTRRDWDLTIRRDSV